MGNKGRKNPIVKATPATSPKCSFAIPSVIPDLSNTHLIKNGSIAFVTA